MADRPSQPRLAPVSGADVTDEMAELLGAQGGVVARTPANNVFATLVRHPGLYRKWLPFAGKLLAGKLPPRDRELLILRTGWNCRSEYEWGQHTLIAEVCGLSADEIRRVAIGPDAPEWNAADRALLQAADELHDDACLTDATWAALSEVYDERLLLEAVMLVGHYHMLAFALNSAGVQREEGVPGFPGGA
jgi:4-carboxymuconolactone decarboxylase